MMLQLNPTIEVHTPLGDGEAMFIIDYGINVNTVWVVRLDGGVMKHFYSDDIRVWGNPMNGKGWDCEKLEGILRKLPPGTKRNTDFLKKENGETEKGS